MLMPVSLLRCRSCTSAAAWMAMARQHDRSGASPSASTTTTSPLTLAPPAAASSSSSSDCPPDVEHLGRSSWTLLHSLTATYPTAPTPAVQAQTSSFLALFSGLYPCGHCAEDFRAYLRAHGPRLSSRAEFGTWMCEAHNAVNEKLGKERFDCALWEERWRTGPGDGRCG